MNLDNSQNSENEVLMSRHLINKSSLIDLTAQSNSFLPQVNQSARKQKHIRFPSIQAGENSQRKPKILEILSSPKSRNLQNKPVFYGSGFTINQELTPSQRPTFQYSLQQSGLQNSLLVKYQSVSNTSHRDESNIVKGKPLKEIFTITKAILMKSVHILTQITGKNQSMLFTCRIIHANSTKLSQCLQMITPPFYLNSQELPAFRTINERVKHVYENFKRESPEINETVVQKHLLCIIEIQKLMRVFEFSGIELKFEKLLTLLSQIGLLYFDKRYGYVTEYLWFLSIVQLSYSTKMESTKLLMMSLQPEAKIKTAQLIESDIPKALLRLIEQRTKENKVNQHRLIKLKQNANSIKFIQAGSTPVGAHKNGRNKLISKRFGIEPPLNNALLVYDSQQDLYDTLQGSSELNKYQFFSIEVGYLSIARNKHLLEEDPDLKEELAIFGPEEASEYPVWIRVLYQHTQFTDQILRLTKLYFYDHENTARGNPERDFFSPPSMLEDYIVSNHFETLYKNSTNPIKMNQIFNELTINLKGRKENIDSIEIWPPKNSNTALLTPDQYKPPVVYAKNPELEDESDFEDDYNQDLLNPLLVKQMKSYHIYFEQSRLLSSTTVDTRNDYGTSLTSSQNINDQYEQIKQAFQFTEQFLNNSQTIEFESNIKIQFTRGSCADSSEEDSFEITEEPLFITTQDKPILKQPKLNRLKSDVSSSTCSIVKQRPKTPKKRAAYHYIKFNMEEDTMFQEIKSYNYQDEQLFGAVYEESTPQSKVLIPSAPQFVNCSSEDVSFDETPIHFEPKEFLENRQENEEFEFCNGLVLKKELVLNYEDGAGVAHVDIYHKEKIIHSIEGLGENQKIKWSLKFYLPNKLRKFCKQKVQINTKGKNFKGLQLLTRQVGNKKFLTAFSMSAQVKQSEIEEEEKALQSPQSMLKTDESHIQTPVIDEDQKDQSSIIVVQDNFKFFDLVPLPIKWRTGQFKILIRYSTLYTSLREAELNTFNQKLQWFKSRLTEVFPQIKIKENTINLHEIVNPEQFEVLIRGVGQMQKRLAQNFYPLFIKNELLSVFLYLFERQVEEVYENLALLSWFYGGTQQMAAAQREFLLNDQEQTKYPYKFVEA